jgi:CubicO group peptidase (beta-lactamase class C family)
MKKLILITLFCTLSLPAFSQDSLEYKLNELLSAYENVNLFNGTVLVAKGENILLKKGYGFSRKNNNIKNTINTKFQAYSVTKSITATLILKLIEENKLSFTDNISIFFPDFLNGDRITIEHLLTHTSGIYAYNNDFSMPVDNETSIINFLKKTPLDFLPGTDWNYNNTGYFLLGFIIQKVTGLSYKEAVKKFIFEPLQMEQSGFNYKNLIDSNKSTGYQYIYNDTYEEATLYDEGELFSAGGMYSTVDDLYKFHLGMQANKIISKELSEKAYTPFKKNYGYGWFIDRTYGYRIISHSGGASGFRSYLIRNIENDICIVLLCNSENSEVSAIKNKILAILFGRPYHIPKQVEISTDQLFRYEGAYSVNSDFTIYINYKTGRLIATPSRQSSAILLPQSESRFYIDEIDGFIEFRKSQSDAYDTLVLFQDGNQYNAVRINATWGVTGSSTPGGWDGTDISLKNLPDNKHIWAAQNLHLTNGEIKFRFNNDWTISLGVDTDDNVLKENGQNIKVKEGNYDIKLDFTIPDQPKYLIKPHQ